MKTINPLVYEKLTPRQRVIATIEAMGRDDKEEVTRLVKTCPKLSYRMNETNYSDKMDALQDMAMAVECDMRGSALNFFMLLYLDDHFEHESVNAAKEKIFAQISEALSIKQAWHELLEEQGINPIIMDKAFDSPCHYGVEWVIGVAEVMNIEPTPDLTNRYKETIKEFWNKI